MSRFDIGPHKQVPKVFWAAINNLMSLRDRLLEVIGHQEGSVLANSSLKRW